MSWFPTVVLLAGLLGMAEQEAVQTQPPPGEHRLTAAVDTQLRSAPALNASPIAVLPLGTEVEVLDELRATGTWHHVLLADGRTGYLRGDQTHPITGGDLAGAAGQLAAERLQRQDAAFPERVQLFAFLDAVPPAGADTNVRGRLALRRLQALRHVLENVPLEGPDPAQKDWLYVHRALIVYHEPAGLWIIRDGLIWNVHDQHRNSEAADELAWLAVTNGLPGECEGYPPCYVARLNQLEIEYLRRHPTGRHADSAMRRIAEVLESSVDTLDRYGVREFFDPDQDCESLATEIRTLRSTVESTGRNLPQAVTRLDSLCAPAR